MMTVAYRAASPSRLRRGFTLIEVMIVIVIIGVLTAIALPNYRTHMITSNRATAQAEMMAIASKQEQYLLANRTYASKTAIAHTLPTGVSDRYDWDITVGSGSVPSYTINFTAKGSQLSDGDLSLDNNGTKLPAAKWK